MPRPTHRTEPRRPTPASLAAIADAAARLRPDTPGLQAWFEAYARRHRERLAFDLDYVAQYLPVGGRILECGALPPLLTVALRRGAWDVTGVDVAPERFQGVIRAEGLTIWKADIETARLPSADDQFDGVLFNEIFEHLRINPVHTMREILRVLKPGGTLLLSTPNLTSLPGWVGLLVHGRAPDDLFTEYRKLEELGHMGHVRQYSPAELWRFLAQVGFTVTTVIYRGTAYAGNRWKRLAARPLVGVAPRLRPHFTLVAVKAPAHAPG